MGNDLDRVRTVCVVADAAIEVDVDVKVFGIAHRFLQRSRECDQFFK